MSRCIKKIRDKNNKITGYEILVVPGGRFTYTPENLKRAIRNKSIVIDNLTLTSDNRLIDKKNVNRSNCMRNNAYRRVQAWIDNIRVKSKILGANFTEVLYNSVLERYKGAENILYYDSINNIIKFMSFNEAVKFPEFSIYVTSMEELFYGIGISNGFLGPELFNYVIKEFNTNQCENMSRMFTFTKGIKTLDLRSFNTANVITMEQMFKNIKDLEEIDLTSFNTNKVEVMRNI